jgi:hypothetical protein
MAKTFTKDDVPKIEDLWFNFIRKTRDLGPDHEVTNRLQLVFVDGNRETSMKVTHNIKDKPKEDEE